MPPPFKFAGFILMWIVSGAIILTMIGTKFLSEGGLFGWILALVVAAGVLNASGKFFEEQTLNEAGKPQQISTQAKAKRGGDDLGAMLALLDDDDADDLRERIKLRLLDRIEDASTDDMQSFEQLLNSRDRHKRR